MPLIIQAAEDKSWRVRLCLSKNFTEIAANFGKEVTDMSLIQTYSNLLKDPEVDVKIEAVKCLSNFIKIVSQEKINYLLPQVTILGKDALAIVRGMFRCIFSKRWSNYKEHDTICPQRPGLSKHSTSHQRTHER